ncbi:MAG: hypothetical protein ACKO2L_16895 [Planctomycetaceae bacterium]
MFIAAQLFLSEFSRTLAVFLHEHAHIFGHDGSRGFSDAFTKMLEATVEGRTLLDAFETEWNHCVSAVRAERDANCQVANRTTQETLDQLSKEEMQSILQTLPEETLINLLSAKRVWPHLRCETSENWWCGKVVFMRC